MRAAESEKACENVNALALLSQAFGLDRSCLSNETESHRMGVRCPPILVREAGSCQVVYLRPVMGKHLVRVSLVMHITCESNIFALRMSTFDGVTAPPGCV